MKVEQPFKLLLTYDIRPEARESYFRFVTGEFIPQANALGLELAEVWETVYGDYPHRLIVFMATDLETINRAMSSERYKRIETKLMKYVINFSCRTVKFQPHFQF